MKYDEWSRLLMGFCIGGIVGIVLVFYIAMFNPDILFKMGYIVVITTFIGVIIGAYENYAEVRRDK